MTDALFPSVESVKTRVWDVYTLDGKHKSVRVEEEVIKLERSGATGKRVMCGLEEVVLRFHFTGRRTIMGFCGQHIILSRLCDQ